MNSLTRKLKKIEVDKDRFDGILQRIAGSKPLPVKDLSGTFTRNQTKRKKVAEPEP